MLKGKEIVVGITGGIAAYKAAYIVSRLKKEQAGVTVVMTRMAQEFVTPLTFQSLTANQVITDLVMTPKQWEIEHIALAKKADIVLIAPATANFIDKCAAGIADDFLSTLVLATKAPILICPAMNKNMYENQLVQENIQKLAKRKITIIEPETGRLACGDEGAGRLAGEERILAAIRSILVPHADFQDKTILITAGPTQEPLDDIRFISNRSSGKMGYALAREAALRGAEVILVTGPTTLTPPKEATVINVQTALEMYEQVLAHYQAADIVIAASAVGDFRPRNLVSGKIKKKNKLNLELIGNPDILQELGKRKKKQLLVGFAAESGNLEVNARKKMQAKGLNLIIANKIKDGFSKNTNKVILLWGKNGRKALPVLPKEKVAKEILDKISAI
ncbi:MAG: bifunctional phosphopantothenoylcysteine decarboxylase/phosphopantothenate--cysteine ligase CoaBC [bacterium]|nr:bifunctional phosphopantothenoylcysteine decarboxylase/phosphopantothenate--cysteine ligase CoaBC [bacterium]MDD5353982.1 bifunctional phosphopantothenoylcysteine decarboxylase/phosphopantothenate--cysteine ligase CoaBC [bacterium]MDD5756045.1 bifunctional phosphopantothenoylcysteine decarboxylase/phosphopantothenate--cysteine ligase CoaBC [bacterium]